jgi:hypothetical protein
LANSGLANRSVPAGGWPAAETGVRRHVTSEPSPVSGCRSLATNFQRSGFEQARARLVLTRSRRVLSPARVRAELNPRFADRQGDLRLAGFGALRHMTGACFGGSVGNSDVGSWPGFERIRLRDPSGKLCLGRPADIRLALFRWWGRVLVVRDPRIFGDGNPLPGWPCLDVLDGPDRVPPEESQRPAPDCRDLNSKALVARFKSLPVAPY